MKQYWITRQGYILERDENEKSLQTEEHLKCGQILVEEVKIDYIFKLKELIKAFKK